MLYEKLKLWVLAFIAAIVMMAVTPARAQGAPTPPPTVHHTADDITNVLIVMRGDDPIFVVFLFNDGAFKALSAGDCDANEGCQKEVLLLLDQDKYFVLRLRGQSGPPDTTT